VPRHTWLDNKIDVFLEELARVRHAPRSATCR
jgi:hypothetical protein